jgi:uncharacterized protein YegP (UPF0339 family)
MEIIEMFYWLYPEPNGDWRWTLYTANQKKIANSGEGYRNKADCIAAINLVKGSKDAPIMEPKT